MNTRKARLGLVGALVGLAGLPALPVLADPMRPLSPPPAAPADAGTRAASPAAPTDGKPAPAPAPSLLAIRRDSNGLRQAWLEERWVGLGDRVQGQPVTELGDHHVVLGRGADRRTLHLLPPLKHSPQALLSKDAGAPPAARLADAAPMKATR